MVACDRIQIGSTQVQREGQSFLIAEAGVNHNGEFELAKQLVIAAKAAGADCVKFQTFQADRLALSWAPKAAYQRCSTDANETQLDMLSRFELTHKDYERLVEVCRQEEIVFLSTPYSFEDVDLLESLGVPAYKIASGQAVEPLFLEYVGRKGKPIILSTGMCTLDEVKQAVKTIRQTGNEQIVVMQCTTDYPAAIVDANLRAMVAMRDQLEVLVGYSDHTETFTAAIVARSLGACMIERHFTINRSLPGPDQSCSLDPEGFRLFVCALREAESALGSSTKTPSVVERGHIQTIRRGVVAAGRIAAGDRFTLDNLTLKRPLGQLSGAQLSMILGRHAAVDIDTDTPLTEAMIR